MSRCRAHSAESIQSWRSLNTLLGSNVSEEAIGCDQSESQFWRLQERSWQIRFGSSAKAVDALLDRIVTQHKKPLSTGIRGATMNVDRLIEELHRERSEYLERTIVERMAGNMREAAFWNARHLSMCTAIAIVKRHAEEGHE